MKTLRYLYRRFISRRRRLRVAQDFDLLLELLNQSAAARRQVRKVLRVRGYEG